VSLHVIDTDVLSLYQHGHPGLTAKLDAHPPQDLAITVITVEEEVAGWYVLLRRARRPEQQARVYERLAERRSRSLLAGGFSRCRIQPSCGTRHLNG